MTAAKLNLLLLLAFLVCRALGQSDLTNGTSNEKDESKGSVERFDRWNTNNTSEESPEIDRPIRSFDERAAKQHALTDSKSAEHDKSFLVPSHKQVKIANKDHKELSEIFGEIGPSTWAELRDRIRHNLTESNGNGRAGENTDQTNDSVLARAERFWQQDEADGSCAPRVNRVYSLLGIAEHVLHAGSLADCYSLCLGSAFLVNEHFHCRSGLYLSSHSRNNCIINSENSLTRTEFFVKTADVLAEEIVYFEPCANVDEYRNLYLVSP